MSTHQRMQGHFQLYRARIEALESSLKQNQAEFLAEHRLRATIESQLLMERESNDKADLRLTRALTTIEELASTLHLMRVDSACLSGSQKEELRTLDYAEIVLHWDALLVESAELRNMLARGPVAHQSSLSMMSWTTSLIIVFWSMYMYLAFVCSSLVV